MSFLTQVTKQVLKEGLAKNESVICSPASINAALRILTSASANPTQGQLLKCLGHDSLNESNADALKLSSILNSSVDKYGPVISSVNALWLDRRFSFNSTFHKVLRDVHNADARAVDFKCQPDEVVKEVNSWAEETTRGLIKQVIARDNIKIDTLLMLANALYFKGAWQHPFDPKCTEDGDFNLLNGRKVPVSFMNKSYKNFPYGKFEGFQVLSMPYESGSSKNKFSMYIFLPDDKDGLPNLMENIKIVATMFDDRMLLKEVKITELSIPKFRLESYVPLLETMKHSGLTLPFEKTCTDFSGIFDGRVPNTFYVDDIFQKCFVETNERGTEAAAVTSLRAGCSRFLPPPVEFIADHPFMFMIKEDVSGDLLFVGSVLDPK